MLRNALTGETQNQWIVDWYYQQHLGLTFTPTPGSFLWPPRFMRDDLNDMCDFGFQTGKEKFQRLVNTRTMKHRGYRPVSQTKSFTVYADLPSRRILAAK